MHVDLWTDGGVRTGGVNGPTQGKSGRGAIGFVIRDDEGNVLDKRGVYIGDEVTVNECEYTGVALGLFMARELGATHVTLYTDSQLVAMQLRGIWACRQPTLFEYLEEAKAEIAKFEDVAIEWVPRERNQHADMLTREVLGA